MYAGKSAGRVVQAGGMGEAWRNVGQGEQGGQDRQCNADSRTENPVGGKQVRRRSYQGGNEG